MADARPAAARDRWFAQRPSEKEGYISVLGPLSHAEAEAQVKRWQEETPGVHGIYCWQHPEDMLVAQREAQRLSVPYFVHNMKVYHSKTGKPVEEPCCTPIHGESSMTDEQFKQLHDRLSAISVSLGFLAWMSIGFFLLLLMTM